MNPVHIFTGLFAINLAATIYFFLPEKEIPYSPEKCGVEHFIRGYGGTIRHDAWLCKNPSLCFKDK